MRFALALLPALAAAQSWHVGGAAQVFASFGPQGATRTPEAINPVFTLPVGCVLMDDGMTLDCVTGKVPIGISQETHKAVAPQREAPPAKEPAPVRLRITASRQPISVLRAITKEKPPEGAGIFAVRACNVSASSMAIDAGVVEQMLEAHGIALVPRPLAALAVKRARSKGMSMLARFGEVSALAAPLVLGMAAGGVVPLKAWQAAAVGIAGTGLDLLGKAAQPELAEIGAGIGDLGGWLSDSGRIALAAGDCSGRLLAMGSYSRGQSATVVIEVD